MAIAVFLIIGARICYVTAHARLPEQNVIAQGENLTYRGLTYIYSGEDSGPECAGNDAFNSVFPCI